jgi:hypothetical protein
MKRFLTAHQVAVGAILASLVSFVVYVRTMAPTVAFWDAGEFIAASYVLGVPHPPGTPFYVLLGRVFTLFPTGLPIAVKVNLMSALFGAISIGIVYAIAHRIICLCGFGGSRTSGATGWRVLPAVGAWAGSLALAFSITYWNNCVEAEVYALACLLAGLAILLAFKWYESPTKDPRWLLAMVYVLSLSVGNHLTTLLVAPGIMLAILFVRWRTFLDLLGVVAVAYLFGELAKAVTGALMQAWWLTALVAAFLLWGFLSRRYRFNTRFVLLGGFLFVAGVLVHLYLPIRSRLNPPIDEADPETWQAFWDVLNRTQYGPSSIWKRKSPFPIQLEMFWDYFRMQYTALPLFLGFVGVAGHVRRHLKSFLPVLALFLVASLGLVVYLNFKYPVEKYMDVVPDITMHEVRNRDYFYTPAFYVFAFWIAVGVAYGLALVREKLAALRGVGAAVVALLVGVGIALPALPLAANYHEADRSGDYVARDYGANMLASVDQNGIIFTNGDNDTFPLWYLQEVEGFRKDISVVNLSLLNTPWYMLQIKSRAPSTPMNFTDDEIAGFRYGTRLAQDMLYRAGGLELMLDKGKILRVQDLGVLDIIRANNWERPIYFAVTVSSDNKIGLDEYLTLEGLVFKIGEEKGEKFAINVEKTMHLMENVYDYRGLFDPTVHKTDNTRKLLSNYAAAYARCGREFMKAGEKDKAKSAFERAAEIVPHDYELQLAVAHSYYQLGELENAQTTYQTLKEMRPGRPEAYQALIFVHASRGEEDLARLVLEEWLARQPDNPEAQRLMSYFASQQPQVQPQGSESDTGSGGQD